MTFSTGYGSMPYSVGLADFNDDGQFDVAVANYGYGNIGICLGLGNGSFLLQTIYSTSPASDPYLLAVGDINNDTRSDIVISSFRSNYIIIFFGVGNGTFVNKTLISLGYGALPSYVTLGDVNNDYLLDIAITNYGFGNIEILSNMC
jgi:hypothetical protein